MVQRVAQTSDLAMKKMPYFENEVDFLETNLEEPVREVAVIYTKYWIDTLRDHTSSYTIEELVATNNACITQAFSTSVQLEGPVKDLRAKNMDLAQWLDTIMHYEDAISTKKAQAEEA